MIPEAVLEKAKALDGMEPRDLQRLQVALLMEIAEKLSVIGSAPKSNGAAGLTPTAVAAMIQHELDIEVEPEKVVSIAKMARDEKQLLRAIQRVKDTEDVKNPLGFLYHVIRKWNSA